MGVIKRPRSLNPGKGIGRIIVHFILLSMRFMREVACEFAYAVRAG